MIFPQKWPQQILQFVQSVTGWLVLFLAMAKDSRKGVIKSTQDFVHDYDAWFAIMQTTQFDETGALTVYEGLATRHEVGPGELLEEQPDRKALKKVMPLVWFFYKQKDRFPENTLGHGCAVGLLHTVFTAAKTGASRVDIIQAVRFEMNAQLKDASGWQVTVPRGENRYEN